MSAGGDVDPLPRFRGLQERVERLLRDERVLEVRMELRVAREALEELAKRRDERVLVADDVPGPPEVSKDRDASCR